jgi:NADH-quinone oxidoreductase subunit I
MGYLEGFGITLRQHRLFGGKRVTTSYSGGRRAKKGKSTEGSDEKIDKPERLHGRHVLNRNDPENPTSPGERFGFVYEINYLRCIHCDLCVEACPTEAITESKMFEFSFTSRTDAIYTKAELVVDDSGKPKQLPWEDWREGEDLLTSGWMRATAPSGDASFVGEVGWSNELGYGLRSAEPKQAVADTPKTVKTISRGPAANHSNDHSNGHGGH